MLLIECILEIPRTKIYMWWIQYRFNAECYKLVWGKGSRTRENAIGSFSILDVFVEWAHDKYAWPHFQFIIFSMRETKKTYVFHWALPYDTTRNITYFVNLIIIHMYILYFPIYDGGAQQLADHSSSFLHLANFGIA